MTFDELEQEFYEDLNGRVTAVRLVDGVLEMDFTCDHWRDYVQVAVTLECVDAVHWTVTPSSTGLLRLRDDHPMLWEHNDPHAGYGLLARGPRPVLDELYRVAAPFVKCGIVGNHPRAGGFRLLEMDSSYVVCRAVRLRPDRSG